MNQTLTRLIFRLSLASILLSGMALHSAQAADKTPVAKNPRFIVHFSSSALKEIEASLSAKADLPNPGKVARLQKLNSYLAIQSMKPLHKELVREKMKSGLSFQEFEKKRKSKNRRR